MHNEAVSMYPYLLEYVPDHLKTQEMCDKAFWEETTSWQYVPDWFAIQQQVKLWHDDDDYCDDEEIFDCNNDYQKHKVHKAKIEKELMRIVWYPSRW